MSMCLAYPGKIISITGDKAIVDYDGEQREVSIAVKPEARIGDYVLVSAKFVMEIVPTARALETIALWKKGIDST